MAGQSTVCAWCRKPLLDAVHAKKHVLTQCPDAPAARMFQALKELLDAFDGDEQFEKAVELGIDSLVVQGRAAVDFAEASHGA